MQSITLLALKSFSLGGCVAGLQMPVEVRLFETRQAV